MKIKSILFDLVYGSVLIAFFLLSINLNIRLGLPVLSHPLLDLLGIIFIFTGAVTYIYSFYLFKSLGKGTPVPIEPPKKLVIAGLYKYTRNPMYLGIFSIILGGFFIFGYFLLLIYAFLYLFLINLFVIFYEEPKLKELFGKEYSDYIKYVPRWLFF